MYLGPTWFKYTLIHSRFKSNANRWYQSVQLKLQNSESVSAILTDIKKFKGGPAFGFKAPFISTLEALPAGVWPGKGWMNPWREEKDGQKTLWLLPDGPAGISRGRGIFYEIFPLLGKKGYCEATSTANFLCLHSMITPWVCLLWHQLSQKAKQNQEPTWISKQNQNKQKITPNQTRPTKKLLFF